MSVLDGLRHRLKVLLRGEAYARDVERELQFHLELDSLSRSRDGSTEIQRETAARRLLGSATYYREEVRQMTLLHWVDRVRQDAVYTWRGLRRSPAFAAAVVVTLALGIGVSAAMFSVVDQLLFRSPPLLKSASSVRRVYTFLTTDGKERSSHGGYAVYADLSKGTSSFDKTAAFLERELAVGSGDATEEKPIGIVTASFFEFFNAPPALGRVFVPAEDLSPDGSAVAVASYATWQTTLGGRREAVGSSVQIGSVTYTIVGVMPRELVGLWPHRPPAYFIPMSTHFAATAAMNPPFLRTEPWWTTYKWGSVEMMVRMKPAVTDAAANADLTRAFSNSGGVGSSREGAEANPLHPRAIVASVLVDRGPEGSSSAKVAVWLAGVALAVLLVACASAANLLLARALNRRRETAVRLALGASRLRLVSQLLMESLLLACAGGAAGILMAQLTSAGLRAALLPDRASFSLWRDDRTLLFASASVLAVGVLAGLASVMQATRAELARDIKAGAQHANAYRRTDLRAALVVLQIALSVLLLVGAGLFVRSLQHVRAVRLGYDADPVFIVQLNRRGARLEESEQVELRSRLVASAKSLQSVENASLANGIPFYNSWREGLFLPGASTPLAGEFELSAVSPSYFATMQTRIIRGRGIEELDGPTAPLAVIVGESMAAALWPGKNPIGQCIGVGRRADPCAYVVGVAEDIKAHGLDREAVMHYYLPAAQFHPEFTQLLVRVRGDASRDAEAVRRALQREMPGASYVTVSRFSDVIGSETRSWRLGATVFTAFGLLALVLAAIGLYSVIMYSVAQRTHELAIRTALGAKASDLVRLVVLDGVRLGIAGVVIGGVLALVAGHWVEPLLFQESPRDASVFALVIGVLVAVAFAASWFPANRASRAEPLTALRYE